MYNTAGGAGLGLAAGTMMNKFKPINKAVSAGVGAGIGLLVGKRKEKKRRKREINDMMQMYFGNINEYGDNEQNEDAMKSSNMFD